MPKSENQKLKLLYLLKILTEETDEEHVLPMGKLLEKLSSYGINAARKSIYDDVERLKDMGYDILYRPGTDGGYFLASREFELMELKLLVDAVQASRFITESKSAELSAKLTHLASVYEARALSRQVVYTGSKKAENEKIYYSVDAIQEAMRQDRRISFAYLEWTLNKQLVARHGGKRYDVSPWALLWNDENYYLIGYDEEAKQIKHFRVDKFDDTKVEELARGGKEAFDDCRIERFSTKTFGMFGGEEEMVTLQCHNELIGVMIDRFGKEVSIQRDAGLKDQFRIHVHVAVSGQFFGWLTGIGSGIRIVSPANVAAQYREYLKRILEQDEC
ncbi:MAG: WYL domain-containing protein [Lachnospiraceae bacterium]|nr:WYL domain-containing protein [Lachnospiraceae bacterium]